TVACKLSVFHAGCPTVNQEVLWWDNAYLNGTLGVVCTDLNVVGAIPIVSLCKNLNLRIRDDFSHLFFSKTIKAIKLRVRNILNVDLSDASLHDQSVLKPVIHDLETFITTVKQVVHILGCLLCCWYILSGLRVE